MTTEHAVVRAGARVVIPERELLARVGMAEALFLRALRAGLVVPLGRSTRDTYYHGEAVAQLERVQTLLAAGYAERDVALVVGRVQGAETRAVARVVELEELAMNHSAGTLRALVEQGLLPIWGVTEAGRRLLLEQDEDLALAITALASLGLDEHTESLGLLASGRPTTPFTELRARIEARLVEFDGAAKALRRALPRLARRFAPVQRTGEEGRVKRLGRLLRRPRKDG